MKDYVSLHNHTKFSILDSLIDPDDLFKRAKELNQPAIAITDHGTLSCASDALIASKKYGVKLIMGLEAYFTDDFYNANARLRHLILIAKNQQGYKNLLQLNKEGFDNAITTFKRVIPRINWEILEKYSEGLICTTACANGILGQLINTRKLNEAKVQAIRLKSIFGDDLALEIQPNRFRRNGNLYRPDSDQVFTNRQLVKLGDELSIKVIIATNAHFLTPDQHQSHDVLLSIGSGQPKKSGNRLTYSEDFYVKSRDEIVEYLSREFKERVEEFCDNTLYFANKCEMPEWIDPKYSNPSGKELPNFPVKKQKDYVEFKTWWQNNLQFKETEEDQQYLRYRCELEFNKRVPTDKIQQYRNRVEEELDVFYYCGVSSYMLIVADFLEWARNNNISVGPGRGSAGGSYVGFLLNIHEADSIKYGLLFPRFHNKLRTSLADIDVDLAAKDRNRVIDYLIKKYGEKYVAHVTNYNTLTSKPYARSISRVFEYGGDRKTAVQVGNELSGVIPADVKDVEKLFTGDAPLLNEYANQKYPELKTYAKDLNGIEVALSTHAAALVICARELSSIVPLRRDKEGNIALEYEKERAEANGLVKLDLLGLSTLDIIDKTIELVMLNGKNVKEIDCHAYDKKAYDLISRGDTFGVFQFGTSGSTIDLCKKIQPKSIEDLAIITTLARPACKEIREDYIKARQENKMTTLMHPLLENAFKETFGFPLYDESLLMLAKDVATWELDVADNLRKLTKLKGKYPGKVKQWHQEFVEGATKNGLSELIANKIWVQIVEPYGKYSFNKSHAVLYSLISFKTAYLKAHFPLEFLVANLMFEVQSNSPIAEENAEKIKTEIRKLGVKIIPPDINKSEMVFKIIDDKTLMSSFDSIKFMGNDAIPEIIKKRPFDSFEEFLTKVDTKNVRTTAICAMAACGALDCFKRSRKQMFLYAADYKKKLQVHLKRKKVTEFNYPWPVVDNWTIPEVFALEKHYLGQGLHHNKFLVYNGFFNKQAPSITNLLEKFPDSGNANDHFPADKLQIIINSFFEFKVKKEDSKNFGKTMARLEIETPWGEHTSMVVFANKWPYFKDRLKTFLGSKKEGEIVEGIGIYIKGSLNYYEGSPSILFEEIYKACPPPQLPKDLKAKSVKIKIERKRKIEELEDKDELLDILEEELIEDGEMDYTFE